jgi:glycosyltransferase involved in cell wall biosynthesis
MDALPPGLLRTPRFDHIAITSVFGNPRELRTWSGAPANVASGLERLGVVVKELQPRLSKTAKIGIALRDMLSGRGRPVSGEQILRSLTTRRLLAAQVAEQAQRRRATNVMHTGTLDLLPDRSDGLQHYLYCDHTWALARRHHIHSQQYTERALGAFEEAERQSLDGVAHVFTFGAYVRDNLITHYGLAPDKVTAVGSGMGAIQPWHETKNFGQPRLLFVAKHLFQAKGGVLLVEAFRIARKRRRDIVLTIVGDPRSRAFVPDMASIEFRDHLPWEELQRLYREATLLVQPMLNDPWGQVYLEAMVSRTPVMGLARNGLPELVDGGRHGFLVDRADPESLAEAILSALSDPHRLESMAERAQAYVLATHSWDRVAERILFS